MGQRQVREGDTVDDGSREDQVIGQQAVDAADDTRDAEREGSVRRPLIRATLKHPDGTPPPPREPPVFTMHQQMDGDGRDAPSANQKQGRGRGGQPRSLQRSPLRWWRARQQSILRQPGSARGTPGLQVPVVPARSRPVPVMTLHG